MKLAQHFWVRFTDSKGDASKLATWVSRTLPGIRAFSRRFLFILSVPFQALALLAGFLIWCAVLIVNSTRVRDTHVANFPISPLESVNRTPENEGL